MSRCERIVPQRGHEDALIGVGPASDAGEDLTLGVRALPADTQPAEIAFVDIPPEATRDLPDARGVRRAVDRGRGRGRRLVEARGIIVERIAIAERQRAVDRERGLAGLLQAGIRIEVEIVGRVADQADQRLKLRVPAHRSV